jgi:hypothetical protein
MKLLKVALKVSAVILAFPTIFSCSKTDEARNVLPSGGPYPTILVAQAQFLYEKKDGKKLPKPGPAILTLKQKTPKGWKETVIEDPQSNVFHKALIFNDSSKKWILTIGAMEAALKLWQFRENAWHQTLLWNPVFGGKWNRLRDVETGDVTGDGKPEIVIATHDQGVVAVAMQKDQGWEVKEIDSEPGIFVHEVEIGDVDGDGKNEFFVTPSRPNKARGGPQPGKVVMYKWNGADFDRKIVDSHEKTHAKEILVCDIDGKGIATLFSVFEAETRIENGETVRAEPVKIKKYTFKNGAITNEVIATLDDFQCRFLTAGDVDGDGRVELVAAAMKSGIWLLKRQGGLWKVSLIDPDSSGYEHATYIDDLDGDGVQEIFVASDDQKELRMYRWNGKDFSKTVLSGIPENRITWNVVTGRF